MQLVGLYRVLGAQHLNEISQRHGFGNHLAPFIKCISNRQRIIGRQIRNVVFRKNPIHCPFISLRRIRSLCHAESAYFIIDGVCRVFLRRVYKAIIRYFITARQGFNQSKSVTLFNKSGNRITIHSDSIGNLSDISKDRIRIIEAYSL